MKKTRIIMGMPVTIEIVGSSSKKIFERIFDYFKYVDEKFSTYKKTSEISKINRKEIEQRKFSDEMNEIFKLAEKTKQETDGFFDIYRNGKIDPSGIVKGWAIYNAACILNKAGFKNFYVEAGGDIEVQGVNSKSEKWRVGIKNPFKTSENVKVIAVSNVGVATSGTYERGFHIYNPKTGKEADSVASITVIGPNIYEADRFATAAFAMGATGIEFIERQKDLEGYMIDKKGIATYTSGFEKFVV